MRGTSTSRLMHRSRRCKIEEVETKFNYPPTTTDRATSPTMIKRPPRRRRLDPKAIAAALHGLTIKPEQAQGS